MQGNVRFEIGPVLRAQTLLRLAIRLSSLPLQT